MARSVLCDASGPGDSKAVHAKVAAALFSEAASSSRAPRARKTPAKGQPEEGELEKALDEVCGYSIDGLRELAVECISPDINFSCSLMDMSSCMLDESTIEEACNAVSVGASCHSADGYIGLAQHQRLASDQPPSAVDTYFTDVARLEAMATMPEHSMPATSSCCHASSGSSSTSAADVGSKRGRGDTLAHYEPPAAQRVFYTHRPLEPASEQPIRQGAEEGQDDEGGERESECGALCGGVWGSGGGGVEDGQSAGVQARVAELHTHLVLVREMTTRMLASSSRFSGDQREYLSDMQQAYTEFIDSVGSVPPVDTPLAAAGSAAGPAAPPLAAAHTAGDAPAEPRAHAGPSTDSGISAPPQQSSACQQPPTPRVECRESELATAADSHTPPMPAGAPPQSEGGESDGAAIVRARVAELYAHLVVVREMTTRILASSSRFSGEQREYLSDMQQRYSQYVESVGDPLPADLPVAADGTTPAATVQSAAGSEADCRRLGASDVEATAADGRDVELAAIVVDSHSDPLPAAEEASMGAGADPGAGALVEAPASNVAPSTQPMSTSPEEAPMPCSLPPSPPEMPSFISVMRTARDSGLAEVTKPSPLTTLLALGAFAMQVLYSYAPVIDLKPVLFAFAGAMVFCLKVFVVPQLSAPNAKRCSALLQRAWTCAFLIGPLSFAMDDALSGRTPRTIVDRISTMPDLVPFFAFNNILCGAAHAFIAPIQYANRLMALYVVVWGFHFCRLAWVTAEVVDGLWLLRILGPGFAAVAPTASVGYAGVRHVLLASAAAKQSQAYFAAREWPLLTAVLRRAMGIARGAKAWAR